jgi:hypothetical protein
MGQTHQAITQHLAERVCWQAVRRDDSRVAMTSTGQPSTGATTTAVISS